MAKLSKGTSSKEYDILKHSTTSEGFQELSEEEAIEELQRLTWDKVPDSTDVGIERPLTPSPHNDSLIKRSTSNLHEILQQQKRFKSFESWKKALNHEWEELQEEFAEEYEDIVVSEQTWNERVEECQKEIDSLYRKQPVIAKLMEELGRLDEKSSEYNTLLQKIDETFSELVKEDVELQEKWNPLKQWSDDLIEENEQLPNRKKQYDENWQHFVNQRYHTKLYVHQLEMYGEVRMEWLVKSPYLHTDITQMCFKKLLEKHQPELLEVEKVQASKLAAPKKSLRFADLVENERSLELSVYFDKEEAPIALYKDEEKQTSWQRKETERKGELRGILLHK